MSPVSALSSSTGTKTLRAGWTKVALESARLSARNRREALNKAGVLNMERPIKITATAYDPSKDNSSDLKGTNTKIIHFQRHGQGYHNLIGEVVRELGNKIDLDGTDPTTNPFIRSEIVDSPLTITGFEECSSWRNTASTLNPQCIIVSPLLRTIQTAMATFADFTPQSTSSANQSNVPWIVHEGCREELGYLTCNKRRPISQSKVEFPFIDFSYIESGDIDELWYEDRRETVREQVDRGYHFMADFVRLRPENEIAIVSHSAFLFNLLNAAIDCGEDEDLRAWFLTSEVRSMKVTFHSS